MKLEKREITLNEFDSLKDAFYMEKSLLFAYAQHLCQAEKKETRAALLQCMCQTGEDMLFIADLMQGSAIENKKTEEK